jgi:hypothetical protein
VVHGLLHLAQAVAECGTTRIILMTRIAKADKELRHFLAHLTDRALECGDGEYVCSVVVCFAATLNAIH